MRRWRRELTVLAVLALSCAGARADDTRSASPADPDPGFLEFLGSVDRLSEVNPDYLSQAGAPSLPKPGSQGTTTPPPPPPPPPRPSPPPTPPSASNAPGVQSHD
jgi:type IV secretory pathway VirB10-like protein